MELTIYNMLELVAGLFLFWTALYILSSNPFGKRSWISFGLLMGLGVFVGLDPVLMNTATSGTGRLILRIFLEWPIFIIPIFMYQLSIDEKDRSALGRYLGIIGYLGALAMYVLNIANDSFTRGGVIKDPTVFLGSTYLVPGHMFIAAISFSAFYLILTALNIHKNQKDSGRHLESIVGVSFYLLTLMIVFLSYYQRLSQFCFYSNVGLIVFAVLIVYSFIQGKSGLGLDINFGRRYTYKTAGALVVLSLYGTLFFSFLNLDLHNYIFLTLTAFTILLALAFYDWLGTFLDNLINNIRLGTSLITDEEAYYAIRNYCLLEKLDESTLIRLKLINKTRSKDFVTELKKLIDESIEYLRPHDPNKRSRQALKYHLLKMIAYDQAEEGQILWELGFEEYPVRIMSNEKSSRPPLFKVKASSDYSYASRNAYLALKREAIHDVAWRISYLEKNIK